MPDIPSRATTYRGTVMRSRLEASYAQWLDEHEATWAYEPTCYAGPTGQWLPDFVIEKVDVHHFRPNSGRQDVAVEVKPYSWALLNEPGIPDLLAGWAEIVWATTLGMVVMLEAEGYPPLAAFPASDRRAIVRPARWFSRDRTLVLSQWMSPVRFWAGMHTPDRAKELGTPIDRATGSSPPN
jgi:hypothetical protein